MPGRHDPHPTIQRLPEVVPVALVGRSGVEAHSDRQPQPGASLDRRAQCCDGSENAAANPSPPEANTYPPWLRIVDKSSWSCSASDTPIESSCSHSAVDPSMSVNRNVTVPDGRTPREPSDERVDLGTRPASAVESTGKFPGTLPSVVSALSFGDCGVSSSALQCDQLG